MTTRITMYLAGSRRVKGAGREARQYEPSMREGELRVFDGMAILPNGNELFGDGDLLPDAMKMAERDGWETDRESAYISSCARALRRDSEPVRNLRRLAMQHGHGGNGLHKALGVARDDVAMWRQGVTEIPAAIAAKIAGMLV